MADQSLSSGDNTGHPELQQLRKQLHAILRDMADLGPVVTKPPVIDSSFDSASSQGEITEDGVPAESVAGHRALRDAIKRDLDVLESFLADPSSAHLPALSTNAPYLIAVWNEVLLAPPPVVCIWQTYHDSAHSELRKRGSRKAPGVKIDVVAENGHRWIRVNTAKNSRMLAEFRELDSYLADSDSDSDSEASQSISSAHRPKPASTEVDNSLLRMGRALLTAAQQNPIPGTVPPKVPSITLRLTRLDPSPADSKEHDARIGQTIDALRDVGIDVQLGEREITSIPKSGPAKQCPSRLEPTLKVNLDLSILIALVSDITHAPLPQSVEEAEARFVPPSSYIAWKRERTATTTKVDVAEGPVKHSRALANQALQERGRGLLEDIYDRLASMTPTTPFKDVEFWTTFEARDRFLRIVLSKIGGAGEQRRARALFASVLEPSMNSEEAEEAYWLDSRYPKGYLPLLPIRVFDSDEPPQDETHAEGSSKTLGPQTEFPRQLAQTCRAILSEGSAPAPPSALPSIIPSTEGVDGEDEPIPRAATTRANPRLTAHTVRSLLWGAINGWTTMTANRGSVKAILREVKTRGRAAGVGITGMNAEEGLTSDRVEKAAIWVVDPRSLAEGMRSDLPLTNAA